MSFEQPNFEPLKPEENSKKEKSKETTPRRLMLALEALLKLQTRSIETTGLEYLREIPPDSKIVVATTHMTDIDVPLAAYALGNELNLAIANESVHHHFTEEPSTNIGLHIAGKENFIPIDFEKEENGKKRPRSFNPDNFLPMKEALNEGKSVVIAAQNPSQEHATDLINAKGGYGAVYLVGISDAVILPVSVEVVSGDSDIGMYGKKIKTFVKKPDIKIHIGHPIKLEKIEGVDRMSELMKNRSEGRLQEFSRIKNVLEQQSQFLLAKLAELLPNNEQDVTKDKN